ncbi:MAG TPA: hypothetical protein VF456_11245 [Vicinamibacterales bacterium]
MRQFVAPLAVAAFIALFGTSSWAKTMTVKGQVVDEGCSLREMGQKGGDQKAAEMDQCAIDCAKRGEPVALLTADGKVYRISGGLAANNNAKLIAHMGHTVEITGDVSEKDGKVLIAADALKMVK